MLGCEFTLDVQLANKQEAGTCFAGLLAVRGACCKEAEMMSVDPWDELPLVGTLTAIFKRSKGL